MYITSIVKTRHGNPCHVIRHQTSSTKKKKRKEKTAQLTYLKRAWATTAENQDHSTGQARHPATNARWWSIPARLILFQSRATSHHPKKRKGRIKKEENKKKRIAGCEDRVRSSVRLVMVSGSYTWSIYSVWRLIFSICTPYGGVLRNTAHTPTVINIVNGAGIHSMR